MLNIKSPIFRSLSLIIKFVFISLVIFNVFRTWYIIWQWDRVNATDGIFFILIQGLRFDLISVALFIIIPASLTPYFFMNRKTALIWNQYLKLYLSIILILFLSMELSTKNFIEQYDARPNILFVEYLSTPREVFSMLWQAYPFTFISAAIVLPLFSLAIWKFFGVKNISTIKWFQAIPLSLLIFIVFALCARSSFDHRPANPSVAAFSTDLMANDLALNSTYSLAYALYETRRDKDGGFEYGKMPETKMLSIIKNDMAIDEKNFIKGKAPTLHKIESSRPQKKPLNVVIILQESLGAEFVGSLGGLPLTPNIDALAKESLWFEHLYATGTRSVRGIEAVISGFTPTPAKSVVKLTKSQRNFFTYAKVLQEQGYDTSFIYGGEAHFDNMQRFFMDNGFNRVLDEKDYINPVFVGSWGVSDEDLFNKAHETFSQYGDKPFFSLVFSSSNHLPFEFPDGRIELFDAEKNTANNAVKYADYAVGEFFKQAKQSNYWDKTIFLVIADHNSRVFGANLVPIERFHIPGFIIGSGVTPKTYPNIVSQIDLLPTVLSLAGINTITPAIGHDLSKARYNDFSGRAIMQYNTTQAYMEGNEVVVLEKNKVPKLYIAHNQKLSPANKENPNLIEKALAHSIFGSYMYSKQLYDNK